VAINFPYCAVGAPYSQEIGAAYVYFYDGTIWNLSNRFLPSDGTIDDSYGQAVALSQTTLAAGAPLHKFESGPGAVYLYDPGCMTTGK
jgi:FG-GAP repeat